MNESEYHKICEQAEQLRITENPYWNAGVETVSLLRSYITKIPVCSMLEIGTSNGYTALRVVPTLMQVGGSLVTVESHQERGEIAQQNFHFAEVEDVVTLIHGHAPEVFDSLTEKFDLVFLDATKYEHVSYVEQLFPFLKTAVTIVADNVLSHKEAMGSFVEYMRGLEGFVVEVLPVETGILVATRKAVM